MASKKTFRVEVAVVPTPAPMHPTGPPPTCYTNKLRPDSLGVTADEWYVDDGGNLVLCLDEEEKAVFAQGKWMHMQVVGNVARG